MKSITLSAITVLIIGLSLHISSSIYYTNNPTEMMIAEKENWSHKRVREFGQIKPEVSKSYTLLKQKRVLVEGHYFYKSITLIDTLPDGWIISDL